MICPLCKTEMRIQGSHYKLSNDDTPDKALKRAEAALKFVIAAYEKSQGKAPSKELVAQITNAIPVVHDALDAAGTLSK